MDYHYSLLPPASDPWDRLADLDACQGYVVLVADPETGEADAHGPYIGLEALHVADGIRRDVDAQGLGDIAVTVTRLHRPRPDRARN